MPTRSDEAARKAPSQAARPTVVVRRPPRTHLRDTVAGILGLLLILAAVGLAYALPVKDVLADQYQVTYTSVPTDLSAQSATFLENSVEGKTRSFAYDIPDDDVFSISVALTLRDDVAASTPDRFQVQLFNPKGEEVGVPFLVSTVQGEMVNPPPDPRSPCLPPDCQLDPGVTDFVVPRTAPDAKVTFLIGPRPEDTLLEQTGTTAQAVQAASEAAAHLDTRGTWTVRITLIAAGDCRVPGGAPTQVEAIQLAVCRQESHEVYGGSPPPGDSAEDLGNPVTVGSFTYVGFVVAAERLA